MALCALHLPSIILHVFMCLTNWCMLTCFVSPSISCVFITCSLIQHSQSHNTMYSSFNITKYSWLELQVVFAMEDGCFGGCIKRWMFSIGYLSLKTESYFWNGFFFLNKLHIILKCMSWLSNNFPMNFYLQLFHLFYVSNGHQTCSELTYYTALKLMRLGEFTFLVIKYSTADKLYNVIWPWRWMYSVYWFGQAAVFQD